MDYTVEVRNPHATDGKKLDITVTSNIALDRINKNVEINSKRDLEWISLAEEANTTPCLIIGGGPSLEDEIETIRNFEEPCFTIAINGAARFLVDHDIVPCVQFIIDARPENLGLLENYALQHILASQCDPALFDEIVGHSAPQLVHLASPDIEAHMPPEKVAAGGYTMIGGAASAGNSAINLAYVMGFRDLHVFGFDSSAREGRRHAYEQPLNKDESLIPIRLGDRVYFCSYSMAVQSDYFPIIAKELEKLGCRLTVYGDGLLPEKWRLAKELTDEKTKYQYVWSHPSYGRYSPAEQSLESITNSFAPGKLIDLGCGTGRAAAKLTELGYDVTCLDFVDARDDAAKELTFLERDLSEPLQVSFENGYCCDVMEHIPPEQVDTVLGNIARCVDNVFFRIEFEPDGFGPALIGSPLHLSVHDEEWWKRRLHEHWPCVYSMGDGMFMATREEW